MQVRSSSAPRGLNRPSSATPTGESSDALSSLLGAFSASPKAGISTVGRHVEEQREGMGGEREGG